MKLHTQAARKDHNAKLMLWVIVVVLAVGGVISCSPETTQSASIVDGCADLASMDLSGTEVFRLDGNWFYWPGKLVPPRQVEEELASGYKNTTPVPGRWDMLGPLDSTDQLQKGGTLALRLDLPLILDDWALRLPNADSAMAVFMNGVFLAKSGSPSFDPATFRPANDLVLARFKGNQESNLLVMHVANLATPYTGTWAAPLIGRVDSVFSKRQADLVSTALVAGSLIFMGLYHLALFLLRRDDKGPLWFGIVCIMMAIRTLMMGERILLEAFPETFLGWELAFKVEHLSAHLTLPLFMLFFRQLFPRQISDFPVRVSLAVGGLWALMELFTPAMFHHRFLSWYEYFLVISAGYLLVMFLKAMAAKVEGAVLTFVGVLVMAATIVNDVLLSTGQIQSMYLASYGVFGFTFVQSFILSRRFSNLFNMVARYSTELERLNQSLQRFIPQEVLRFLDKQSIIDVELGDYSEERMSVFFLDIRDFTSLSESMSPNDNFRFINSFLRRFGPVIREHGGFVDKYLGDGIMALFPGEPDRALRAALAMRALLKEFNESRIAKGRQPIAFGIGIHSGSLMLGTIGENKRMDSTVISDTVNTASRLEAITRSHETDVLVSAQTVSSLAHPEEFLLSHAGREAVKGRIGQIDVYTLDWAPKQKTPQEQDQQGRHGA